MPPPGVRVGGGDNPGQKVPEQGGEDGQREPGAGLAVGAVGEGFFGQGGDMDQRGIAGEDLAEKPGDGGEGIEDAGPEGMTGVAAGPLDDGAVEEGVGVLPDALQRGIDAREHAGASEIMGCVTPPHDDGRPPCAQLISGLEFTSRLVPFGTEGIIGDNSFRPLVCQACREGKRCKSSAGRDDRNRKARQGCPPRGGI